MHNNTLIIPFFKINNDSTDIILELKRFYNNEKFNNIFQFQSTDSKGIRTNKSNWDYVKVNYPKIEEYRIRYNLHTSMFFFIYTKEWWEDIPHCHVIPERLGNGAVCFPIEKTSTNVVTQFYNVLEPEKIFNPSDASYQYLRYNGSYELIGEYNLTDNPVAIDVTIFHKPVLTTPDTSLVEGRVICHWKAACNVVDLAKLYNENDYISLDILFPYYAYEEYYKNEH